MFELSEVKRKWFDMIFRLWAFSRTFRTSLFLLSKCSYECFTNKFFQIQLDKTQYLFILDNCIFMYSSIPSSYAFRPSFTRFVICDPALLRPIRYNASLLAEPSIWLQSEDVIVNDLTGFIPHALSIVLWTWPKKDFVQKASCQWIIKRHFWCVLGKTRVTVWWN